MHDKIDFIFGGENCKKPPQLVIRLQNITGLQQIRKSPQVLSDRVAKNTVFSCDLVLVKLTLFLTVGPTCRCDVAF